MQGVGPFMYEQFILATIRLLASSRETRHASGIDTPTRVNWGGIFRHDEVQ